MGKVEDAKMLGLYKTLITLESVFETLFADLVNMVVFSSEMSCTSFVK